MLSLRRWKQGTLGERAVRVSAGAGMSVFPCFVGDSDPRLVRIGELETEQWLVSHHEERHDPDVRTRSQRIAALLQSHGPLFAGDRPAPQAGPGVALAQP